MDFLSYWDKRIEANKRLFANNHGIANFLFDECELLYDHMTKENNELKRLLAIQSDLDLQGYEHMRDELQELRAQFAASERANASLSAWHCEWATDGGKYSDEYGHARCHAKERVMELELEVKRRGGTICGERRFSEALCNDLRSKLEASEQRVKALEASFSDAEFYRDLYKMDNGVLRSQLLEAYKMLQAMQSGVPVELFDLKMQGIRGLLKATDDEDE